MIRTALEYINAHYTENITISFLAVLSHMSKNYFMRIFKETAGVGAIGYINQLRIRKSCELLVHSRKNIAEIAYECGFSNISHFNRQFLKQNRMQPGQYRKAAQAVSLPACQNG